MQPKQKIPALPGGARDTNSRNFLLPGRSRDPVFPIYPASIIYSLIKYGILRYGFPDAYAIPDGQGIPDCYAIRVGGMLSECIPCFRPLEADPKPKLLNFKTNIYERFV